MKDFKLTMDWAKDRERLDEYYYHVIANKRKYPGFKLNDELKKFNIKKTKFYLIEKQILEKTKKPELRFNDNKEDCIVFFK